MASAEDSTPTMKDLNRYVTKRYAADWKDVGLELNLEHSVLKNIQKNNQEVEDRFGDVLDKWLKSNTKATWRVLEIALTNVNRQQLGLDPVEDVYDSDVSMTSSNRQSDATEFTSPPDFKDLNLYVLKIGRKWFDLGVQLLDKDGPDKLDVIEKNNPKDVEKCCSEMFQFWIKNKTDASWKKLIAALKTIGLAVLANEIEKKHCKRS